MSLPSLVSTNYVLTSGANNALTWTNILTLSTVNYSSLVGSTISVSTLNVSNVTASTLQTPLLQVSTLTTSTIGTGVTSAFALDVRGAAYVSTITAPIDQIDQGPYLLPSAANSSIITAWINKVTNTVTASSSSFWSAPVTSAFGTIATTSGANPYHGGVLLPDGRVLFIPTSSTVFGIYNPALTGAASYTTVAMSPAPGAAAYYGGVVLPDGRVVCVPHNATSIGIFNPATNTFTTTGTMPGSAAYYGGVLLPDGRVVFVPHNATTVGIYLTNTPASKEFCLHPCFNKL